MLNKTMFFTALFAAIFMTLSLKFLHFFDFIKRSPVEWIEYWDIVESEHIIVLWLFLFLALLVLFAILYIALSFTTSIPPAVTAIIVTLTFILIIELFDSPPKPFLEIITSVSIPFLAVTAIVFRFIVGTAVFMKNLSINKGNELPRKNDMIK